MAKDPDKILSEVEDKLKFLSLLGVEFVSRESSVVSLEETILNCQKCPLAQTRTQAVPGEGNLNAQLMFIGEAPGRDEDIQGRPFVGRAGQLLTKIIHAMTFQRDEVYITNIVKCRPPGNRNPQGNEITSCKDYLLAQIEQIDPKVIVTLGKVAADFFIRSSLGMTALRGDFYDFDNLKVMPTFHPSYLIRNEGNKTLKKMVWEDMKKVMAFLGKK
ncbi:MAG: uracil-DNA glycosylase [Candidatus Aminicenantes bacterium]|nr:MAG: uracil-DNA glycosylase [Candidatus Aminicenantes bacterium]